MTDSASGLKVGYIVKMYPRLSETFILNEMLELERKGVELVLFSIKKPNEGRFHPGVSGLKAKVYYLEDLEPKKWGSWLGEVWPSLAPYRRQFWELMEESLAARDNSGLDLITSAAWVAARAEEFDLCHLHSHFASLPSTVAYLAHRITGIPFSFTAHAKDIFVYDMREHLLDKKLRAADFVVTVTNYNYRYLTDKAPDLDPDIIKVIYNGVDIENLNPGGEVRREENLILGVGRLVPKKGFDTLLKACGLLKKKGIPFRCLIAGDGQEAANLTEQRRELGLDDEISFPGPKTHDEIVDLMHNASIMCLPCTVDKDGNQDALPTVLLEALACGLPVVSTTVSGIPEIIDSGINGLLVRPEDPESLAAELEKLLKSRELRDKFAHAGRQKAIQKFDLKINADTLLKLYMKNADRTASKQTIISAIPGVSKK